MKLVFRILVVCITMGGVSAEAQNPDLLPYSGEKRPVKGLLKKNYNEFSINLLPWMGSCLHSDVHAALDLSYRLVLGDAWALRANGWISDCNKSRNFISGDRRYNWKDYVFNPDSNRMELVEFYKYQTSGGGRFGLERFIRKGRWELFGALEMLASLTEILSYQIPEGGSFNSWYIHSNDNRSDLGFGLSAGGRFLLSRHWLFFFQGNFDVMHQSRSQVTYMTITPQLGFRQFTIDRSQSSSWHTNSFPFFNSAGFAFRF